MKIKDFLFSFLAEDRTCSSYCSESDVEKVMNYCSESECGIVVRANVVLVVTFD